MSHVLTERLALCAHEDLVDLFTPHARPAPTDFGADVVSFQMAFKSQNRLLSAGDVWTPHTLRFLLFPIGHRENPREVTPLLVAHLRREETALRLVGISGAYYSEYMAQQHGRPIVFVTDEPLYKVADILLPDEVYRDPRRVLFDAIETRLNPTLDLPFLTDRDAPHLVFSRPDMNEALFRRLLGAAFLSCGVTDRIVDVETAFDRFPLLCRISAGPSDGTLVHRVVEILQPTGFKLAQLACGASRRDWSRAPHRISLRVRAQSVSAIEQAESLRFLVDTLGEVVLQA